MSGLRVREDELHHLLVSQLELIGEEEFERARRMATRLKLPLERALVERGRIPMGFLLRQLADSWGVAFLDLKVGDVKPQALESLPEEYARAHMLVVFDLTPAELHVAMEDPRDRQLLEEIQRKTKRRPIPYLAPESAIRRAHLLYRGDLRTMLERAVADETLTLSRGRREGEDESVVALVTRILEYAAVSRASDIHIEPYELEALVRYRVDGALQEMLSMPAAFLPAVTSRIKILSGLRIDEQRVPQDGRFEANLGGLKMDLRVSTLPTQWGEKLVLRVLAKESLLLDLEDLGLIGSDFEVVLRNILRPYGLVLVTGPTGSGKSTTLYAMLQRLGVERQNVVNISTIEDPVEYSLPRVNQVPLHPGVGMDFASGLRALLRQDPDVIMVGEIRDRETVDIAIRAALVGRLLISTLHTNDAVGAVPRLLDMGAEPFLVASTLSLVIGQRLVRRICAACRESVEPDALFLQALRTRPDFEETISALRAQGVLGQGEDPLAGIRLFRGKGCRACSGTGFRGRLGVYELFEVDQTIRTMIMERRDAGAIRRAKIAVGMKTMFQDGLAKVLMGETTLEEVSRVAM
jgi:type IV pilus assembly protein PilB